MRCLKRVIQFFRNIYFTTFRMPENMLVFLSGIVLSAAINVATNGVKQNGFKWDYDCSVTISMFLMFVSSVFFTWMAIYIKPLQELYKSQPAAIKEGNKDKWVDIIKKKNGATLILGVFFLLTYVALAASVVLLFWNDLEVLWRNILSPQASAIQPMN